MEFDFSVQSFLKEEITVIDRTHELLRPSFPRLNQRDKLVRLHNQVRFRYLTFYRDFKSHDIIVKSKHVFFDTQ